jgi:hypothetical protein
MNVRETMIAALRRDSDLIPKVAAALRGRKDESDVPPPWCELRRRSNP